jgi:hypothetical protein
LRRVLHQSGDDFRQDAVGALELDRHPRPVDTTRGRGSQPASWAGHNRLHWLAMGFWSP